MPDVVAAVLVNRSRIGLFKRSRAVTGDRGRWHCITGYLPAGTDPLKQARTEVFEEAGLGGDDVSFIHRGTRLVLPCPHGTVWHIVPFLFLTARNGLELNWEHDDYQWVRPTDVDGLETVSWLRDVLCAIGRLGFGEEGMREA